MNISEGLYIIGGTFLLGCTISYFATSHHYDQKLAEIDAQYRESVQQARAKENEWKELAKQTEAKYQEELTKVTSDANANADLVSRLRKQLSSVTCRMPSTTKSSSKSNGSTRESQLSGRVADLVEFSGRCSKQADQLALQLKNLQTWIQKAHE